MVSYEDNYIKGDCMWEEIKSYVFSVGAVASFIGLLWMGVKFFLVRSTFRIT